MQSKILVIWRAIQLSEVLSRENGVEFRRRLPVSDKKSGTVQRDANCRQDEAAALLVWNRCFRIVLAFHSYELVFKWGELAPFLYENSIGHRNFSLLGALYDTIYYVSFATLCEKWMCSVVKGQLIGELAIRCACCWAFRGQEWRELRRLATSIMCDHSQVLFESRGVECGERAFDAKQVEAWQKAQKNSPKPWASRS